MAVEFDLSKLKKGSPVGGAQNSGITRDRNLDIPIPSPKNIDPIFDTPPVTKVQSTRNNEIHTINESNSTTISHSSGRTPIISGKPPVSSRTVHADEPVDDPQPLKVMNHMVSKSDDTELTPFNVNSLPKKKKPEGEDETEAYDNLAKAVDLECQSISQRIKDLTQKQYDELLEARQEGKYITPPDTDEETERKLRADVESHSMDNDKTIISNEDEVLGTKRIIVRDENDEDSEIELSRNERMDSFGNILLECIYYVKTHVLKKDVYSKVLFAKNWLAERYSIYSNIYCIVMYDKEGNTAVHPMLVADKKDMLAIVEVNETGAQGVHILDPNDTISGVCASFVHKGLLYDYIDYIHDCKVIKMPVDMPPSDELAIRIATENSYTKIIGVNDHMEMNDFATENSYTKVIKVNDRIEMNDSIKQISETDSSADLEDAIDPENHKDIIDMVQNENVEVRLPIVVPEDEDVTIEEENVAVDNGDNHTEEYSTITIQRNPLDDNSKIIESSGINEYEAIVSDDIQKDLARELNQDSLSDEEVLNELKSAVREHSRAIKNRINLRDFTISDTPISAAQVATFSFKDINQADWVLPNAKRVISVRGLSGPELFALNPQNSNKSKINTFRQIYGIIYKHITSKKPSTFDEWLKVTRFSDIDHIYAALHKATFSGSNFIHYECPECHHIFIKDYDFDSEMVTYPNDKAKAKIQSIYRSGDSSIPNYEVELHQISDRYVVGLKDPSIWNMVMETAALSDDFLAKYEDLIDTMSFIDSIYLIDSEKNALNPIDFGYDKSDPTKSTARKITILSDIIRTLSSDNYFTLRSYIAKLFSSSNDIGYQIPAADCPKCNHHFNAEPSEALRMLFTRHQLGALESI